MDNLVSKTACEGLLPLDIGPFALREVDPERMTSIMPFSCSEDRVSELLKTHHGVEFPLPNRTNQKNGQLAIWFGQGQVLLVGAEPAADLAGHAAMCDQSDGWAVVTLQGPGADRVLARLVPVDLRPGAFPVGQTVRTSLQHMNVSITRTDEDTFRIMAYRSMAGTLVHDLRSAMEGVAARG